MPYIYQADVWCDDCGRAIIKDLQAQGKAPEDILDQYTYDSDDFPKSFSDDDEADTPQHCGAGEECLNPTIIDGKRYGMFLHNALTSEGLEYVSQAALEGGSVALFWAGMYDGLCDCFRLEDHACVKCGGKVRRYDCKDGAHEEADDCR